MTMSIACGECGKEFEERSSVLRHAARAHKLSVPEYVIRFELDGVHPTCECGCGELVNWHKGKPRRFVHGHAPNVPEIRQLMIDEGRKAAADPEKREKNSQALSQKWQDDEWRASAENRLEYARTFSQTLDARARRVESCSEAKHEFWNSEKGDALREYMQTDEFSQKVSGPTKIALADPKIREQIRQNSLRCVEEGIIGGSTQRQWMDDPWTGEQIFVHSGWEKLFIEHMHRSNQRIIRKHGIRIRYNDENGVERVYVPDFLSFDNRTLYEVKGWASARDLLKIATAREWCSHRSMEFVLVDRAYLSYFVTGKF